MIKIKNKKLIYFIFYIKNISFSTNEKLHNQVATNEKEEQIHNQILTNEEEKQIQDNFETKNNS